MAKHLTLAQREELALLFHQGCTQSQIGAALGVNQSTISRELSHNKLHKNKYSPSNAQHWLGLRKIWAKEKVPKWYERAKLLKYVVSKLRLFWSPEQIAGRIRLDFPGENSMRISHESIYKYIWQDKQAGGSLYKYLRFARKNRKKRYGSKQNRGKIPNRRGIELRPAVVEERSRVGDWESDLVVGKENAKAIATFVERKTRLLKAIKIESRQASNMLMASKKAFRSVPQQFRLTMTHDNGKEISSHEQITKTLGILVYCANPYHSWERGTNENSNGLLRQFFPKSMDLSPVTQKQVDQAVRLINNRPRKTLNYSTPSEIFSLHKYAFHA